MYVALKARITPTIEAAAVTSASIASDTGAQRTSIATRIGTHRSRLCRRSKEGRERKGTLGGLSGCHVMPCGEPLRCNCMMRKGGGGGGGGSESEREMEMETETEADTHT